MIEIRDLEGFLGILDGGSISKAAERLGITQPALSLKLKKLESDLGVQLFARTPKSMVPLDAAWVIEPVAREILRSLESLKDAVAEKLGDLKGVVRVGCLTGWTDALLLPVFDSLRERFPEIRLRMKVGQTSDLVRDLSQGQLDFAIVARPFEAADGVVAQELLEEHLVLFSQRLPDAQSKDSFREALLSMQWITLSPSDALVAHYWRAAFGEAFPWEKTHEPICLEHIYGVRSLVARIPNSVAVLPSQVLLVGSEQQSPFDTHIYLPQANRIYLLWRDKSLDLRRFHAVYEEIYRVASRLEPTLAPK